MYSRIFFFSRTFSIKIFSSELTIIEREQIQIRFWGGSILNTLRFHVRTYTEKKMLLNQKHSFQKHVYHGFKSIRYRISNIFIGSCSFYELIIYMLLERNAIYSIAFFSQCNKVILFKKCENRLVSSRICICLLNMDKFRINIILSPNTYIFFSKFMAMDQPVQMTRSIKSVSS